jgi:hypothetical protein
VEQQKREIDRLTEFLFTHFVTDAELSIWRLFTLGNPILFSERHTSTANFVVCVR